MIFFYEVVKNSEKSFPIAVNFIGSQFKDIYILFSAFALYFPGIEASQYRCFCNVNCSSAAPLPS